MPSFTATLYFIPSLIFIYFFVKLIIFFIPSVFKHKKSLKGQKILITGAGSGLGRQLAVEFSKHSVCLVLLDINKESLVGTKKLIDSKSKVHCYDCDVSDRRKVYEVADQIKRDVGHIAVIVNNAGIVSGRYLMDLPDEKIVKTIEVNTLAHFWIVKAFLPPMMLKNQGHIVSIASAVGKAVIPKMTDYCASKFAAIGFAECLELELQEKKLNGIKVTIVCPPHMDTGLFNGFKSRITSTMSPEYVAREVVNAVLEEKETVLLPRYLAIVFQIQNLVPRWLRAKFMEILGEIKAMENFTERPTNKNNLKKEE